MDDDRLRANVSGGIFRFSVFHSGSIVFSCRAVSVWAVRFDITERAGDAGARAVARSQAVHLRLTTSEWEVTEQMREFHFNSELLVDAEFERRQRKGMWDEAIARVQDADEPEPILDEQLARAEMMYWSAFATVPEEHLDEMLALLKDEFRRRAGMDGREPSP